MDNPLRDADNERQARLEEMMAEYEGRRQRRLIEYGIKLWNRTESADRGRRAARASMSPLTIN